MFLAGERTPDEPLPLSLGGRGTGVEGRTPPVMDFGGGRISWWARLLCEERLRSHIHPFSLLGRRGHFGGKPPGEPLSGSAGTL